MLLCKYELFRELYDMPQIEFFCKYRFIIVIFVKHVSKVINKSYSEVAVVMLYNIIGKTVLLKYSLMILR